MGHTHRTKDEAFILCLYEAGRESGDVYAPMNRYEIGAKAHLYDRAVNAICKTLIQTNFIRKQGEEDVYLTPHGEKLALRLLEE